MRKILVLRGGALGDFIVTLPALERLRHRWPDAKIELVGNLTAAALARHRGLLSAVHSQHEARWAALFSPEALPPALATWFGEFDLVLNYWPDPSGELRRHFPVRLDQLYLSAPAMPAFSPAARHYCEPMRKLGIEGGNDWVRLAPLDNPSANRTPSRTLAVHPGSGSRTKNWPAERWRALIESRKEPVLLILGEAEYDAWYTPAFDSTRVEIARGLPLETLVDRLSGCARFVGHDSGISHLAAACGLPCVLLFGPTDPAMWAPPAPHVRVIRKGPTLGSISVADVQAALG